MKKIAAEYCIRAVDNFRPGNKPVLTIYGDDTTYNFLEELAQHLSSINTNLLFTVEHLYTEEPEPFVMLAMRTVRTSSLTATQFIKSLTLTTA